MSSRKSRTLDEWMEIITTSRQSGLSDTEWCRRNDIPVRSFENAVSRLIILAYLVQASCNIRTAVPVLSGQWFLQHPDRIPVPSRQDDIYSLLYSFVPTLSFTTSAA